MRSHHMPPANTLILELVQMSIQLIQKHLKLAADQTHLFFFAANSSHLTRP